ncbi:MAG: hypothetical protein ACR2KG_12090 [Nocardioidaceae bacterium]
MTAASLPGSPGSDANSTAPVACWDGADETAYRLTRIFGLRSLGVSLAMVGIGCLVTAILGFPSSALIAVAVVAVVMLAASLFLLAFPPTVLALSTAGYRIRHVRGNETKTASWRDVESVTATEVAGALAVVIVLSEGCTSIVPIALLGARAMEAQREIHARLNSAFGYRRLDTT